MLVRLRQAHRPDSLPLEAACVQTASGGRATGSCLLDGVPAPAPWATTRRRVAPRNLDVPRISLACMHVWGRAGNRAHGLLALQNSMLVGLAYAVVGTCGAEERRAGRCKTCVCW